MCCFRRGGPRWPSAVMGLQQVPTAHLYSRNPTASGQDLWLLTSAPSILPLQKVKSASDSGKAEIPAGGAIMSDMSSEESLYRAAQRGGNGVSDEERRLWLSEDGSDWRGSKGTWDASVVKYAPFDCSSHDPLPTSRSQPPATRQLTRLDRVPTSPPPTCCPAPKTTHAAPEPQGGAISPLCNICSRV